MHVSVPTLATPEYQLLRPSDEAIPNSPSRHEGEHDEGIPKSVIILESSIGVIAYFGQTEDLEKEDRVENEERRPEEKQVADGR